MKEKLLRRLIREAILSEMPIINFGGEDYDLSDEEIPRFKKKHKKDIYNQEKAIRDIKAALPRQKRTKFESVVNVYEGTLKDDLLKVIHNHRDEICPGMFTINPSFGSHSFPDPAWNKLINIHNPGRSNAIGRGEAALALVLKGVIPDSGSGTHDLEISGLGGVHVKDVAASGGLRRPDVPMGKGLTSDDMASPFYQSVRDAADYEANNFTFGRGLGTTILKQNALAILDEFVLARDGAYPSEDHELTSEQYAEYIALADDWEEDIVNAFRISESWGNSAAIIFVDKGGIGFEILGPDESYPTRIENNGWRVGKASAYPGGRFAEALKSGIPKPSQNESILRSYLRRIIK